jgi:putative transposase
MMDDTLRLTDQEVLNYAQGLLGKYLPLTANGYACTTDDLLKVLLGIAANTGTLESVCSDLVESPDAETVRRYFNQQLRIEALPALTEHLNAALAAEIPARVRAQACEVAIDLHDRPYYGKTTQAEGLWVRGQAKAGTTRFYRVATAYVMVKYLRVTLAVRFALPGETLVTLLDDLLKRLKTLRIRVVRLFLDRGFAGIAVMAYLTHQRQPALIACPIRGKTGGTRALCHGRQSYRTRYTFKSGGTTFTANLAVCKVFTTAKRTGHQPRKVDWMIFILIHLDWPPRRARREYRRRFGIESSYRCAGQVRGWTTSPNPAYRFLLIGLSFVLLNVWVHLRWLYTQVPRRGGRWLRTKLFELSRLVKFIVRALERHYGYVPEITAPAAPRL